MGTSNVISILKIFLLTAFCDAFNDDNGNTNGYGSGTLVLSNIFSDHMVIQNPGGVIIGFASPNIIILTLISSGPTAPFNVTSDANGRFVIRIPTQPLSSSSPVQISFSSTDGGHAVLNDIVFGDVFVCIGEGPMAMSVASVYNASFEASQAPLYADGIRIFSVGPSTATKPQAQLSNIQIPWSPVSSSSLASSNWTSFSAPCWFFGKNLYDYFPPTNRIQIGLIQISYGGSSLQSWMSTQVEPVPTQGDDRSPPPSSVYYAMLAPFTDIGIKGAFLSHGITNAPPQADNDSVWFGNAFPQYISSIRTLFANNDLPIAFTHIAPTYGPQWTDAFAEMRDAQLKSVDANTAVVVTTDLGDATSPFTPSYFRNQQMVGLRFCNVMKALAYRSSTSRYIGPIAINALISSASNTSTTVNITIQFDPASVASGLSVDNSAQCPPGIPHDDPSDLSGSDVCRGWRVLTGYSTFPPAPNYTAESPGGFLGAGDDISDGMMTVAEAESACTQNLQCLGFTFESSTPTPSGAVHVYLKSAFNFVKSPTWQTYNSTRTKVGSWINAQSVTVGSDSKSVVVTAVLPAIGDSVVRVQYGYSSWPLHSLSNNDGLPAVPFMINVGSNQNHGPRRLQIAPWLQLKPLMYQPLPLGRVMPSGWIASQLQAEVTGQTGWLHKFYPPVMNSPWISNCSQGCQDTNEGEDFAYWFNAAVSLAVLSKNVRLTSDIAAFVEQILASQDAKGWLGPPTSDDDGNSEWARWPVLQGLLAWREYTGDARILPAILAHVRESYRRRTTAGPLGGNWAGSRWQDYVMIDQFLIDIVSQMGDTETVSFLINHMWLIYSQGTVSWEDWYSEPFFAKGDTGWNYTAHGVNSAQGLKSGAVIYRMSGSKSAAQSSFDRLTLLDYYHGAPTGVFQADETLSDSMPSHGTELCAVVESMYSLNIVHEIQGDASFADRAERIAYNALPGTWSSDMTAHQYLQQANAVNSLHQDDHIWLADGPDATTWGLAPNYPCCTANGGQGWPRFVAKMVHTTSDGGIAISILGPLSANIDLTGVNFGVSASLDVVTDYPFGDFLDITVSSTASSPFNLYIRIPTWATQANVSLNGSEPMRAQNGTFFMVTVLPTAMIHVELNPDIYIDSVGVLYNGAVSIHRGALTYGLSLGESVKVTDSHECPSPDHPQILDYEINSTSAWNIALILDPTRPLSQYLNFSRSAAVNMSQPFDHANPPLQITAMARLIPSWGLVHGSADAPPSSPACTQPGSCSETPFQVSFVPFGSQHLRMSVLPWTIE